MKRTTKIFALLITVIVTAAMVAPMVMAQDIPTSGVVTGSMTPPIIKAKWELPDDADEPSHLTPGTQVLPEACTDKPIEFFMVARDPNGAADIANAGFRVAHPVAPDPGTVCWMPDLWPAIYGYGDVQNLKVSEGTAFEGIYGTQTVPGADRAFIRAAIARGVAANLLTQAMADDLLEELEQQEARFFWAVKPFTCCYAPGDYEIMAWASDTSGGQGELINTLYYESIIAIDVDFINVIDYGELVPGVKQIVSGDEVFSLDDGKPTVKSLGNDPIQIWLHADPMEGEVKHDLIENFDARLDHYDSVDFLASEDIPVPGVLIPNWINKMDFSVTPPFGTPADRYVGTMTLWIEHFVCP